jgi:hypothetical protein
MMTACNWFGYLVVGTLYVLVVGCALLVMWALYKCIKED